MITKSTVALSTLTGKPRLLAYQPRFETARDAYAAPSSDLSEEEHFEHSSPSKMSEEEKSRYHRKLLRESEEIASKITRQLASCAEVRAQMRETIKENKAVLDLYRTEHEDFRARMEYRKLVYFNSSFKYTEMAARNLKSFKEGSLERLPSFVIRRPEVAVLSDSTKTRSMLKAEPAQAAVTVSAFEPRKLPFRHGMLKTLERPMSTTLKRERWSNTLSRNCLPRERPPTSVARRVQSSSQLSDMVKLPRKSLGKLSNRKETLTAAEPRG